MPQQFNVTLNPALVRRVKHHAIDHQQSVSDLVGAALDAYLTLEIPVRDEIGGDQVADSDSDGAGAGAVRADGPRGLALEPLVHVEQMPGAVAFYEALGATVLHGSRDGDFVLMRIGGTELGLLAHPPNPEQHEGQVELTFETGEALDSLERRLSDAGVTIVQPATDEGFGRQLQVSTPDGLLVKINQLDPELYG